MPQLSGIRRLTLAIGLCALAATATAGGAFFDDFDYHADQTALDAAWPAADSKISGRLDTAHAFGHKSMRVEQTPAETRPRRDLGTADSPDPGLLNLWFYDDGDDIKAFDITITDDGTNSASVGLRDDQAGSATNYVCTFNDSTVDTAIPRSEGWHLVQIAVNPTSGTVVQIDKKDFAGNSLPALTGAGYVTVYTNFGNPSDANRVWIDTVQWKEGAEHAVLPADAWVTFIEHFDVLNTANWQPLAGTAEVDVHHITDAGSDGSLGCIDVYDGGGERGFHGLLTGVVPFHGKYRLGFDYENGGAYGGGLGPWENLTVTMNGVSSVNCGSEQVSEWKRVETFPAVELTPGSDVHIEATADPSAGPGFCRLDNISLILTEFTTPPSSAENWELY